jgi:hypothetical protein
MITAPSPNSAMTGRQRKFGMGLDSWNNAIVILAGFAGIFAVLAAIATYIAFQLQKQEATTAADALARYKLETGQRIAEADARTKEAELKLAQLSKKVTPRVLSGEDEVGIIDKLAEFRGTPFAIEADATDFGFVNRVIEILQRSDWRLISYSDSIVSLPPGNLGFEIPADQISGVQVRINASRLSDFEKPAKALATSLTQALRASVSFVFDPPDSPHACSPDAIHVEIRRKL